MDNPASDLPRYRKPGDFRRLRARGDSLGLALLGYLLLSVLSSLCANLLRPLADSPLFLLALTLSGPLALVIPFLLAARSLALSRVPTRPPPPKGVFIAAMLCGAGVASAGNLLSALAAGLLARVGRDVIPHQPAFTDDPVSNTLVLLGCTLFAAFFEELVFRGVVLQALRPWGAGFAIAAQAMLFAACHSSVLQILPALLSGLAFGYFALVSGSLWPGMAAHLFYNAAALTVNLLSQRLGGDAGALLSSSCLAALILAGAVALAFWLRRRPPLPRAQGLAPLVSRVGALFLSPALLIALAALLFLQAQSVVGP